MIAPSPIIPGRRRCKASSAQPTRFFLAPKAQPRKVGDSSKELLAAANRWAAILLDRGAGTRKHENPARLFYDRSSGSDLQIVTLYGALIAANLFAWAWAFVAFQANPMALATALIAYGFGLRHAVDADHIAAIDNVTRKLMHQGKRPIAVGFFFALGHSTVVVAASALIALTASTVQQRFPGLINFGGLIGTAVSVLFLFAIAMINIVVLAGVYRLLKQVRRGERVAEEQLNAFLAQRGLLGRLLRGLFRLISRSWHMYPLGLLFGLGFDTATEIGLLGISASEASNGLSIWSILVFPALFTAGMSLVDTSDGVLMVQAYGWAFMNPVRKLYYNLIITSVSVIVAVAVGAIEAFALVAEKFDLGGGIWTSAQAAADHSTEIGYLVIGTFAVTWLASFLIYRAMGYGKIGSV